LGRQTTIERSFCLKGVGVHLGRECTLTFNPAPVDSGIVFQRLDLPGQPVIRAHIANVDSSLRCTRISAGPASVSTVEHVMAALFGVGVDNCHLTIDGPEVPIIDGSAAEFTRGLKQAGIVEQTEPRRCIALREPVWVSDGGRYMVALPSSEGLRISFTFTNDRGHVALSDQFAEFLLDPDIFEQEIAPARTMGWLAEVEALRKRGLIKGGSIDIAVVIGEDSILTPLRYPNELVRHKILDTVGDLALVGRLQAHVICIRSGHRLNAMLGRAISQTASTEESCVLIASRGSN
jgi:UDP-3-O-[3-hydroxymyristoyl] N-acetylglucosamine deacetylase